MREFFDGVAGLADLLPYDYPAASGVIVGKGEAPEYMASFMVRGRDLDFCTEDQLVAVAWRLNQALKRFGTGWMIQADAVRSFSIGYPDVGAFPDPITAEIDARRRAAYESEGAHFESSYVLTFTFQPESRFARRLASSLYKGGDDEGRRVYDEESEILNRFESVMQDVEHDLRAVYEGVVRLRCRRVEDPETGRTTWIDDQVAYIAYAITGRKQPVRAVPDGIMAPLRYLVASENFVGGNTPRLGSRWIAPLVITGFPGTSAPAMLGVLNALNVQYRWSTRFIFRDPENAKAEAKKAVKKWRQLETGLRDQVAGTGRAIVDADAAGMARDAQEAFGLAAGQAVRMGWYTSTVVLMDEDPRKLREQSAELAKLLANLGFQVREEWGDSSDNAVEAWLGSLPGVSYANVRKPLLHSLNLAHLMPTTATWAGQAYCSHVRAYGVNAPPLMVGITAGSTPIRVTHHDADVGHTAIFGPTGAGKSTLMQMFSAQHFRYPGARVIGFDKGYSAYTLCTAAGGEYYVLGGDSDLKFAPLADVDDPREAEWAKDWLEVMLYAQGVPVDSRIRGDLDRAVQRLGKSPRRMRSMSHLVAQVEDPQVYEALKQYTHDMGHTILDGDDDTISSNPFQIFETQTLLDRGKAQIAPVFLYCFHRIKRVLDGRPTQIPLDEGWTYLDGDFLETRLKMWLLELRKLEASVIFATQQIASVLESGIASVVIDACPTKFFLPNPEAEHPGIVGYYRRMGLNDVEIARIARAVKQRDYYYKTPQGSRMIQLGLDEYALAYLGKAGEPVVERVRALRRQYGDRWPLEWEKQHGVSRWASRRL